MEELFIFFISTVDDFCWSSVFIRRILCIDYYFW